MKTIASKRKKFEKKQPISNPYSGKILDPKLMLTLLDGNEKFKWHATFCKILVKYECPKYSVDMIEDGVLIVHITNKHGFTFNVNGSDWSFVCISIGKYMKDYFEMQSKEDVLEKMRLVTEAFRKMNK